MTTLFRRRRPAGLHAADALTERIPRQPAAEVPQGASRFGDNQHGVASDKVLDALKARAEDRRGNWAGGSDLGTMPAAPTLPFTLDAAQWRGVPADVLPMVPLTLPALIYDGLGGDEKTARPCAHCGALGGREDYSWRYDALSKWSCPACQAQPEWHAPSLPGLRVTTPEDHAGETEMGIMARSLLATNPRCVRQRPDGLWMAAIPLGGRIKAVGPFGSEGEAEAAYGYVLGVFTKAVAGNGAAA